MAVAPAPQGMAPCPDLEGGRREFLRFGSHPPTTPPMAYCGGGEKEAGARDLYPLAWFMVWAPQQRREERKPQ